jgi:Transposase DDE domain
MGMQHELILKNRALRLLAALRQQLLEPGLRQRHRRRPQDFSRECLLTFPVLMLFLLQKSLKSLQARLHEFFWQLAASASAPTGSAGAVTHARAKLLPSAFTELNERAVLATVYGPEYGPWVRRWRGHRLLGIDSSEVRLPDSAALRAHFGAEQFSNQHGNNQSYPEARISVLYDLLNELALDARVAPGRRAETELAREHLCKVQPGDVVTTDRGYRGWGWFAEVQRSGAHFLCRCPRGSFKAVQELFARDEAGLSVIVKLPAPKPERGRCRAQGWPLELTVRLITVRLSTGELEVLATSLWDEARYPTEDFGQLYGWRWGHETYYGRLKGRLDLEHCSGQSVAAVEQDFHALILLSNIESVLIGPAQAQLLAQAQASARAQQPQVNRAVSLHAFKCRLIELLASELPLEQVFEELTQWFKHNPMSVRPGRKVPRRKFSPARSYHYQRRVRKIVF